jgi:hypothetical protein
VDQSSSQSNKNIGDRSGEGSTQSNIANILDDSDNNDVDQSSSQSNENVDDSSSARNEGGNSVNIS